MKRDWLFVGCEKGHDWKHVGGCNAGCDLEDDCCCSVPVYECTRCKSSDYGYNPEADEIVRRCQLDR